MSALTHVQVHGLHVASELALPELAHHPGGAAQASAPDVHVRHRRVAVAAEDPAQGWFHVRADGTAILRVEGVASFAMRGGCAIDVDVAADADPAEVRVYLLGSALGVLLHQRGELPLHVSAVVVDGRAWAFTAPSGTGKSTLAAALHLHEGLALLSDDVAVARPAPDGGEGAWLWPGPPQLKLHADAYADVVAHASQVLPEFVRSHKVRLQLGGDGPSGAPAAVPLGGLVLLRRAAADQPQPAEALSVQRVRGAQAFLIVQAAVYRLRHGVAATSVTDVFDRVGALATRVPCHVGVLALGPNPASAERAGAVARVLQGLAQEGR